MTILDIAAAYAAAGFSVLPIRADGSKAPALRKKWKPFQTRKPTGIEIGNWWQSGENGIAIICGGISRGLSVLDIEYVEYHDEFRRLMEERCPGFLDRLPTIQTPGKRERGFHYYFRCDAPQTGGKLACLPAHLAEEWAGSSSKTTAIELKADGGYVLAPGCPAACHPSGRLYTLIGGPPIVETPTITEEEAALIIECAAMLDCPDEPEPQPEKKTKTSKPVQGVPLSSQFDRPGDDWNHRGPGIRQQIEEAGWTHVGSNEHGELWRRPGKDEGHSACLQTDPDRERLYVFSTSTEFQATTTGNPHGHDSFDCYAVLNHRGDLTAATRALSAVGYGVSDDSDVDLSSFGGENAEESDFGPDDDLRQGFIVDDISNVKIKPIRWLVPGRIAAGKTIIIAGQGGSGKSTLSRAIVAALTTGRCALGETYEPLAPVRCLIAAAEDTVEDTILPGLISEGADLSMIRVIRCVRRGKKEHDFALTAEHIRECHKWLIAEPGYRLLILDPITTYVGRAKLDDHKAVELRQAFDPLNKLCDDSGISVMAIAHLNKSSANAVDKIAGSAAYKDAMRLAYMVLEDPEDRTKRIMVPIKNNLIGTAATSIVFGQRILEQAEIETTMAADNFSEIVPEEWQLMASQLRRVEFFEPREIRDVNSMTNGKHSRVKKKDGLTRGQEKFGACAEWIMDFLSDGPKRVVDVNEAATSCGSYSPTAIEKAKTRLREEQLVTYARMSNNGEWWMGIGERDDWDTSFASNS